MNAKAIADAIATQFVGATANGETLTAETATASLPNAAPQRRPILLVYHPEAVTSFGLSQRREDILVFPVRFLRDPINYPARSDALYAWWDALRDRVEAKMLLGLSYVKQARVTSMRAQIEGWTYGSVQFDLIELTVEVRVEEIVSSVAP